MSVTKAWAAQLLRTAKAATSKTRVRGFRYLGAHRRRTKGVREHSLRVWSLACGTWILVPRIGPQPRRLHRQVRKRRRGKGQRALTRLMKRWGLYALGGALGVYALAAGWLGRRK